jgi:DNA-binding NtrC family response regulator
MFAEPAMPYRILIAEDSEVACKQLKALLEADGAYEVDTVGDGHAAVEALAGRPYTFLLTDLRMPNFDGMQLIAHVAREQLPVTVVVLTGYGSIQDAVRTVQLGAYDFLPKPVDVDHLRMVLKRAIRERGLHEEVAQLREQLRHEHNYHNVLSKSPKMHAIFGLIQNIASTTTTVLIEGETGTGKEQVARAIHLASAAYRQGPLVAVNCAALPETLLESELFGHEKGAFTGAATQRKGRFEMADGGTLFLDEVGDVPAMMQVKLLRVLQERKFERVGGTQPIEVDVRVVAATNRHLPKLVRADKFREDLYYRLNVVKIDLPPLRERTEDIPLLARHFALKYARPGEQPRPIAPEAMEKLLAHRWPGNIRELENAIERASVTAGGPAIQPDDLPLDVLGPQRPADGLVVDLSRKLPELLAETTSRLEKAYLRRALKRCRGNIQDCATISGLSRRSISTKLAEYGINKKEFKT